MSRLEPLQIEATPTLAEQLRFLGGSLGFPPTPR
jgi:hypothetical protein